MKLIGVISISILLSLIKVSHGAVVADNAWKLEKGVLFADGCNFETDDLIALKNKDNKCAPVCQKNPDCTHWAYDGKLCHLKSGKIDVTKSVAGDAAAIAAKKACGFNPDYCSSVAMCKRQKVNQDSWIFKRNWLYAVGCDFGDADLTKKAEQ